ncbi:MAG TPA: efflux transporter outer membrane subunit [Acetobacteraceae bacterium]|nr:efflux transporter outer membrane subunit [Acetobacteraceae bacterium]
MPQQATRKAALKGLATALLLGATGCSVGPDYRRPAQEVPAAFVAKGPGPEPGPVWPDRDWWHGFASPELDALIAEAERNNFDIAAAIARIRQADAAVRIAGAPLLPTLSGSASGSMTQEGLGSRNTSLGVQQFRSGSITIHQYNADLNASYVLDFWGLNRSARNAAVASAAFSRFDAETVRLTVLTSVAQTWFTALELADRLAVAEQNLKDARASLAVIVGRLEAGTATTLDRDQQAALVATEEANIPALRSQLEQQLIGLGILIGKPPEAVTARPGTLTALAAPPVAPGLPSALLKRRPDVASAEAQLVAANFDIKAADAAFFPNIALTGQRGYGNSALSNLFSPGGFIAVLAATASQPIFDGGALRGRLEQAKGRYQELAANYRKAVVQAFTDVETALTAWRYATEQEALARKAVAAAHAAADAARAQMAAGTADVTTLLSTETTLFADQDALVQVRLARFLALLNLYKALGGGWQEPEGGVMDVVPALGPGIVRGGLALPGTENME